MSEATFEEEKFDAALDALERRSEEGDIVAEALLAWGVYTALSLSHKTEVWSSYLLAVEDFS